MAVGFDFFLVGAFVEVADPFLEKGKYYLFFP